MQLVNMKYDISKTNDKQYNIEVGRDKSGSRKTRIQKSMREERKDSDTDTDIE